MRNVVGLLRRLMLQQSSWRLHPHIGGLWYQVGQSAFPYVFPTSLPKNPKIGARLAALP